MLLLGLPLSSHHKHRDAPMRRREAPNRVRTTVRLTWKGEKAGHDSGPIQDHIPFSPTGFLPINESPANDVS